MWSEESDKAKNHSRFDNCSIDEWIVFVLRWRRNIYVKITENVFASFPQEKRTLEHTGLLSYRKLGTLWFPSGTPYLLTTPFTANPNGNYFFLFFCAWTLVVYCTDVFAWLTISFVKSCEKANSFELYKIASENKVAISSSAVSKHFSNCDKKLFLYETFTKFSFDSNWSSLDTQIIFLLPNNVIRRGVGGYEASQCTIITHVVSCIVLSKTRGY